MFTRPFVLCSISNLFQAISFSLFLHLPGFLEELGAGPVLIGWIFSITSLVAIASRPSLGGIMDRRGRRGLILAGHWLNVAVLACYLGIHSIGPLVFGVRVLHGLAEAILFTALFTYAADQVPRSRLTEGLAIFGVSGMFSMSLSGLLGDWILAYFDYSALFVTAWGFAVVALLASLPLRDQPLLSSAGGDGVGPRGFMVSLREPSLLPLWWVSSIFFVGLAAIFIFLKTFVMAREVGSVGGFFTAYTAVAIALRVGLGWLPDRVGPKRVLVPALVCFAVGFGVLAAARSDTEVWLAGFLCGIGHGYTFPVLFGLVVSRARDSERGSAVAIYTGLSDLGIVVGGPLFGLVLEFSGFAWLYGVAAAVVLIGVGVFVPWDRRAAPIGVLRDVEV